MIDVVATAAIGPLGEGDAFVVGAPNAPAPTRITLDPRLTAAGLRRPFAARSSVAEAAREAGEDPATTLLLAVVRQVSAQLSPGERVGLAIGTSSGGMATSERFFRARATGEAIDPALADAATYHAPFRALLATLSAEGIEPVRTTHLLTACSASTLALGLGVMWLEQDLCDVVLAGGYDALTTFVAAGFEALGATTSRLPPRPFRVDRDGMALGEGAGVMVLRRVFPGRVARIVGFGASCDAVHLTAPDRTGGGLSRAALQALAEDAPVDLVSVHGTSTVFNDPMESKALALALPGKSPPVHAAKASIGHTLGAAGVLESILVIDALRRGLLPATPGEGALDPEVGAHPCTENAPADVRGALKLSAAFGGANAALHFVRADFAGPRTARPLVTPRRLAEAVPTTYELEALSASTGLARDRLARMDGLCHRALAAVGALAAVVGREALVGAGIVVGTVLATLDLNAVYEAGLAARGAAFAEGRRFAYTTPNACAGECAMAFRLTGPAMTVSRGLDARLEAREVAADFLATRRAQRVVVVSVDAPGPCAELVLEKTGWPVDFQARAELWGI